MTIATNSRRHKIIIADYLNDTGSSLDALDFKLVDFGVRGVSCMEQAAIGGAAHMVNFSATDNVPAITLLRNYYGSTMPGFSIAAAEHSTITTWGREREVDAFRNMLEQYPTGIVAVVSDSYDIYKACTDLWGEKLRSIIENRDGTLIVRPDSGDPPTVLCEILEILTSKFGFLETNTGHKILPPCIRIIQGDGVSLEMVSKIFVAITEAGFAAENLSFGSGGALLQKMNRDTQKCAFKCSMAIVNGESIEVFKDPVTDPGKRSKRGRLTLEKKNGEFVTVCHGQGNPKNDYLETVFVDGILQIDQNFDDIKARAKLI